MERRSKNELDELAPSPQGNPSLFNKSGNKYD